MKNNIKRIVSGITAAVLFSTNVASIGSYAYSGSKAANYANQYAENYNDYYKSFNNDGGDCTNFVSQCLCHGGYSRSDSSSKSFGINKETTAWYHNQYTRWNTFFGKKFNVRKDWKTSTTWIRVTQPKASKGYGLYEYLTEQKKCSDLTYMKGVYKFDSLRKQASVGDVIQCQKKGDSKSHSVIVTSVTKSDIKVAYHSDDHKNRSFKTYFWNKNTYKTYHLIKIK